MNVAPTALTVMFWFRPIQSGGVILGQPGVWGDWAVMVRLPSFIPHYPMENII